MAHLARVEFRNGNALALRLDVPLEEIEGIVDENLLTAFEQRNLQVVVVEDFYEGLLQAGNLHAVLDFLDEDDRVDVSADVLQESYDEVGLVDGVFHEVLPQVGIVVLFAKFDGHLHVL